MRQVAAVDIVAAVADLETRLDIVASVDAALKLVLAHCID